VTGTVADGVMHASGSLLGDLADLLANTPTLTAVGVAVVAVVAVAILLHLHRQRAPPTTTQLTGAARLGRAAAVGAGVIVGGTLVVLGPGGALVAGAAAVAAGVMVAAAARSGWTPRQIRAPTRAQINAWARAVRAEVTGFWLDVLAGLERAGITIPERPIQWTISYWVTALRFQIGAWAGRLWHAATSTARFLVTPAGLVYTAVAAVFAVATGAMMIWALPAITSMVAFQLRGSLNTFKQGLSQHVWVQRGLLVAIIATLSVNIPHHIRGALKTAAPDANQWISGLFGVSAATTVVGMIAMLAALINSQDSTVRFPAWWDRFSDRLGTLGAAATLVAIPFMVYAVVVHPVYDGIVTIHPVVFALVVATFTGFGGEALLRLVGTLFKRAIPAKLTRFFTVYSAATIGTYGMLYQLHHLLLLVVVTGVATLAGLLHFVLTRPHFARGDKVRHAVVATALTTVNALAVGALFLGWPQMSTGSAIVAVVAGVAATVLWIWAIRGPPGGGSSGSASPPAVPGGPGHGALAVWSPRVKALALQAFAGVYDGARRAEWNGRAVPSRGPPGNVEVWSPDPVQVRRALEELGATSDEVAQVLRAWAFSWRDAEGVLVVAMFADRLAELERLELLGLGLLGLVLEHERRDADGLFADDAAHDADVDRVRGAIRRAQDAMPGALAVLDGMPRGDLLGTGDVPSAPDQQAPDGQPAADLTDAAVADPYHDPDTGVLINRSGITDPEDLARSAARSASHRLRQLRTRWLVGGYGLAHVAAFHRHLFQDVYPS
jgi:hypothetical protein